MLLAAAAFRNKKTCTKTNSFSRCLCESVWLSEHGLRVNSFRAKCLFRIGILIVRGQSRMTPIMHNNPSSWSVAETLIPQCMCSKFFNQFVEGLI